MKIIYLHQYFKTPEEGGAIRSYYIATALVKAGFEVEVITSHNNKKYQQKNIKGILVHYLPIYYNNTLGTLSRINAFLKFVFKSYALAKKIRKQNLSIPLLLYATSTPLTVGWVALRLKHRLDIPYFFEVRDLWPQAPIDMGVINNKWLKKYLFRLEKNIYQKAETIIALSPGIQQGIAKKTSPVKIKMVPNMADNSFFEETEGWPKKEGKQFIISYLGTVGQANHLEYFLAIAQLVQEKEINQIQFWIVGDGKQLDSIRQQARNLKNVVFKNPMNKQGVKTILNQSDATYTSFLQKTVLTTCSPNKFFDSLAAGKLTIVNTNGWLKDLVETYKCGFYANPLAPEEFINKLMPFIEDKKKLESYQQNARGLGLSRFDKEKLCQEVINLVKKHFSQ